MDQEDGESDITVILSNGINKIALLIEDKIDAHAMPMQPERYIKRGKKGIENKQYDEFYDFIVAPQEYLESNMEAKQYTYRVSYEEMLSVLKDVYSVELLNKAIEEVDKDYTLFYQPVPFPDTLPLFGGIPLSSFSKPPVDPNKRPQVFNVHNYCCAANQNICASGEPSLESTESQCPKFHMSKMKKNKEQALSNSAGIIVTEFGACSSSLACYKEMLSFMSFI
jgi:hypothetical protein